MKRCVVSLLLILSCNVRHAPLKGDDAPIITDTLPIVDSITLQQRDILKDFALCRCLAWAQPVSANANDASTTIYYNALLYHDSISTLINQLAQAEARNISTIKTGDLKGMKAVFSECITFAKSAKLDSLIKSFDKFIFRP